MFNMESYRLFLMQALERKFSFELFDFESLTKKREKKSLWLRHDIDNDLGAAVEMARVESKMGVVATYFVMLRSPLYNLFGRTNHDMVKEILALGHHIALHYDASFHFNKDTFNQDVEKEVLVFDSMFGVKSTAVSFHQPSQIILHNEVKLKKYVNTYDKEDMKDVFYCSDSSKNLRHCLLDLLESQQYIQVLIHPMWWTLQADVSIMEFWNKVIRDNFYRVQKQLLETEPTYREQELILKLK